MLLELSASPSVDKSDKLLEEEATCIVLGRLSSQLLFSSLSRSKLVLSSDGAGCSGFSTFLSLIRLVTSPVSCESPSVLGVSVCVLLGSEEQSGHFTVKFLSAY